MNLEGDTFQRVTIDRLVYDQEALNQQLEYEKPKESYCAKCADYFRCEPKKTLLTTFPLLEWLPRYKWRKYFSGDLISGITVAIMHIPQGMAYSLLGNVPAVVGIYMAFFPVLVYFVLGTSKHNSMGTFAIVCLMTGKGVLEYSDPRYFSENVSVEYVNSTQSLGYSPIQVATVITFTVAIFQMLMYILRLGIISTLLSDTLISGFTTSAAFQVLTSQVKDLLGLDIPKHKGYFVVISTWKSIFERFQDINLTCLAISAVSVLIMTVNNEILKPKLAKKSSFPIPIELLMVIFGTAVCEYWQLNPLYGVKIVGNIPEGFPIPAVPEFSLMRDIATDALMIALVSYALTLSMALIFAQKSGYQVDANQELLAQSTGNFVGSFFSCMPFCASISRSLIQKTVGGNTQLASLVSCGVLALVIVWIGPLFQSLPKSVLASIIVVALKGMLVNVTEFFTFWKTNRLDAMVWMATFLTVVLIGIDVGLLAGLLFSLITIIIQGCKPYVCLLGCVPHTDIYLDITRYKLATELDRIKIFYYRGGINFVSRNTFRSELYRLLAVDPQKELMDRKKLAKLKDFLSGGQEISEKKRAKYEKLNRKANDNNFECLILDFSGVSYVDSSGLTTLKLVGEEYRRINIPVYVASCNGPVYEAIVKWESAHKDKFVIRLFPTVHDAVQYASNIFQITRDVKFKQITTIAK